jgi:hypothetical protein
MDEQLQYQTTNRGTLDDAVKRADAYVCPSCPHHNSTSNKHSNNPPKDVWPSFPSETDLAAKKVIKVPIRIKNREEATSAPVFATTKQPTASTTQLTETTAIAPTQKEKQQDAKEEGAFHHIFRCKLDILVHRTTSQ